MCIICYVIYFFLLEIETIINILLKTSILQINIYVYFVLLFYYLQSAFS
jgi:hypothetical protein